MGDGAASNGFFGIVFAYERCDKIVLYGKALAVCPPCTVHWCTLTPYINISEHSDTTGLAPLCREKQKNKPYGSPNDLLCMAQGQRSGNDSDISCHRRPDSAASK
jgi:hypothetical protein